jgi:PPE-PPW subfamily C-terminal region
MAAVVGPETPGQARRRRRPKVEMLGRGYEYMDLDPEPAATPSDRDGGTLGFPGTAAKETATTAAGLATLDDGFGGGRHTPMMPSTWGSDPAPHEDA